jgi:hypothetical protein
MSAIGPDWLTIEQLRALAESQRRGRPLREFAAALGDISYQHLGLVLAGAKEPGIRIPQALGFEPITVYRPIEKKKKASKR